MNNTHRPFLVRRLLLVSPIEACRLWSFRLWSFRLLLLAQKRGTERVSSAADSKITQRSGGKIPEQQTTTTTLLFLSLLPWRRPATRRLPAAGWCCPLLLETPGVLRRGNLQELLRILSAQTQRAADDLRASAAPTARGRKGLEKPNRRLRDSTLEQQVLRRRRYERRAG